EKGAFTGASQAHAGKFEQAQHGTLLLDEVSEMDVSLQAKILRVLQEKEVERLGSKKTISLDVRVLATTNRNLREEVAAGRFREDLFYRLNVIQIIVPPLRERRDDIPLFISNFISEFCKENNIIINEITSKAKMALINYEWPGNIRELRNVLESAVVLSRNNIIDINDLPSHIVNIDDSNSVLKINMPSKIEDIEKKAITTTLKITNGNKSKASQLLGITRKTLQNKLGEGKF
ncbi:MAG: sigma-54-dependent Fis family transcriptional regulator, partial [Spirochaetes bacterium]|nr:sigma-54-dependent Fis family transcriptional regulator [Spirochaetota bacterium]